MYLKKIFNAGVESLLRKPEKKERRLLGRPGHWWGTIRKLIFKKWDRRMERNFLAQDRDRWLALVIVVMNPRFP